MAPFPVSYWAPSPDWCCGRPTLVVGDRRLPDQFPLRPARAVVEVVTAVVIAVAVPVHVRT
ncbi:hypothetical protein [Krasilnikovia sp. MM14-A1259]|uniref:hypothetical protein n=1 Tax=Krasilnikovia sp. MM14-A1259 TaxID=3373539 RepID=UPI003828EAF8